MASLLNLLFRRNRSGDPVWRVADTAALNFVYSVLEDLQGVGCRIEKPTSDGGAGWRIVFDGKTTDIKPPDGEWPFFSYRADADYRGSERSLTTIDNSASGSSIETNSGQPTSALRLYNFRDAPLVSAQEYQSWLAREKACGTCGEWENYYTTPESKKYAPERLEYLDPIQVIRAWFPGDAEGNGLNWDTCSISSRKISESSVEWRAAWGLRWSTATQVPKACGTGLLYRGNRSLRYGNLSAYFSGDWLEEDVVAHIETCLYNISWSDYVPEELWELSPPVDGLIYVREGYMESGVLHERWKRWGSLYDAASLSGAIEQYYKEYVIWNPMFNMISGDVYSGFISGAVSSISGGFSAISLSILEANNSIQSASSDAENAEENMLVISDWLRNFSDELTFMADELVDVSSRISALWRALDNQN